jgi:hypothetical protein
MCGSRLAPSLASKLSKYASNFIPRPRDPIRDSKKGAPMRPTGSDEPWGDRGVRFVSQRKQTQS